MDYILILDQFFSLLENYEDVCGTKIIISWPGYMISLWPRAVTLSYQHFNQQTRHSTNYCSIMILLMLANVDVWALLPIVLPSGGVFGYYNQHRLVVSQSGLAHPVWSHKNNITEGR